MTTRLSGHNGIGVIAAAIATAMKNAPPPVFVLKTYDYEKPGAGTIYVKRDRPKGRTAFAKFINGPRSRAS